MWLPSWLLLCGLLRWGDAAEGPPPAGLLLEISLGKFKNLLLNETVPVEAVLRNVASNVTIIIFQIHAHHRNVTISFDKTFHYLTRRGFTAAVEWGYVGCGKDGWTLNEGRLGANVRLLDIAKGTGMPTKAVVPRLSEVSLNSSTVWVDHQEPSPSKSGTGVDKGLVSVLQPEQTVCTWYLQAVDTNQVPSTSVSLPYTEKDPVPGGCNLEFNLETDPNLYLEYNLAETRITFAPANLGYTRGADPPSCDSGTSQNSRWRLYYDVYQYFLPENDLSEGTFVSHMRKMSEVQSIQDHGSKVMTLTSQDKTDIYFSSLLGQGIIYNVIVRDPRWNTSAAYVPVHTYACSFSALVNNCYTFRRLSTKIFFTTLAVLGLFICFLGHRFWKTGLFFTGFIFTGFFFFIVITKTSAVSYDVNLGLTATAGIIGGLLLVGGWWLFGFVLPCMLLVGLVLGSLVASVLFFTPLGNYKVFQDDTVFWVTFCCVALIVPVIFVWCPRVLNILTCGIVGSYTIVLAISCYIYTSLSLIGIYLLPRILNDNFRRPYTRVPFQPNDIILLAVWTMLAIGGITIQLRRERHEAPFPPHPYRIWKRERERRVTNILDPSHHVPPLRERIHSKLSQIKDFFQKEQTAGERTPLLL